MPSVRSDVVINTGPVLALAAAGYLHVLRDLLNDVTIPYEVVQEIEAGGRTQFAPDEFGAASRVGLVFARFLRGTRLQWIASAPLPLRSSLSLRGWAGGP
jgi:hypothetical protein